MELLEYTLETPRKESIASEDFIASELGEGRTTGPLNYFIYPHVEVAGKRLDNAKRSFRFSEIQS